MTIERFTIDVPEAVLSDLARRLDSTRWPDEVENAGWDYGANLAYMKALEIRVGEDRAGLLEGRPDLSYLRARPRCTSPSTAFVSARSSEPSGATT